MMTDQTKRLVHAVQDLSLARSMERVMEIVRKEARALTGADGASFVLKDRDMCFYADEDAIGPLWKGSRFPMKTCISGWAMINQKPAVIEDIFKDDRIPHDAYSPTFVKSLAMVPIRTVAPIGAIGTYWSKKYLPTEEQVTLLQSLADITAVTIENVNLYNELDQRVKDRTAELEIATAKLQSANQELEAFSYSISHDLKAPLRSIIAYSDILEEEISGVLDGRAKRTLGTVQKNAKRMALLIEDLLRFSKLGKEELRKTFINSDELLNEVLGSIKSSIPDKTTIKVDPLLRVTADYRLLFQVWVNLLSNAAKYSSKKDNPVIEVGSYRDNQEIIFYVKDNGAGFDEKYSDKLFGVFQRLHDSAEFEGVGAGLALTKRIIDRHGGRVWAEGFVGQGANFFFSLPHKDGAH